MLETEALLVYLILLLLKLSEVDNLLSIANILRIISGKSDRILVEGNWVLLLLALVIVLPEHDKSWALHLGRE